MTSRYCFRIKDFQSFHDGHLHLLLDLGFGVHMPRACQIAGAAVPELPADDPWLRKAARLARHEIAQWMLRTSDPWFTAEIHEAPGGRTAGDVTEGPHWASSEPRSLRRFLFSGCLAVPSASLTPEEIALTQEDHIERLKNAGAI